MEMPNTVPNTLNQELLQDKYDIGAKQSLANICLSLLNPEDEGRRRIENE